MTGQLPPRLSDNLERLQAIRGNRVLLLQAPITDDLMPPLYQTLTRIGHTERLELVLATAGGSISTTRQLVMLLHEFTDRLTVLVPYRARSAGTLLCLGAHQLVLAPLAELSPIDSLMGADRAPAPDTPGSISAEDIRAFRNLAEDWFGVQRPEDRLQVLAMLATRIFPTSLSSFYRFDKLVRSVAADLLEFQLPGVERAADRSRIVDQLVSGYHSHDTVLTRRDVRQLGLRALDATAAEAELLWTIWQCVHRAGEPSEPPAARQLIGTIATTEFSAQHIVRRSQPAGADQSGRQSEPAITVEWELSE